MFAKRWIAALFATLSAGSATAFETQGSTALIVDHGTGNVLYAENADQPLPPASMSKLMTLYMLFEAIRDGKVTPETEFLVSARAQNMGGSRMFVEAGERVAGADAVLGIAVQSGNDACVVVAEGLYGTEDAFAAAMTRRARELGLNGTTLKNASGWPEPGHVMSASDLVALSRLIIDEFPDYYAAFDETEFTFNGITQANRNPLLGLGLGVDGIKTGHTSEAGYGLAGSAVQNDQRVVFVVSGLDSVEARAAESAAIVKWAFGAFETLRFFEANEVVTEAEVWLGETERVALVAPEPIRMLAPEGARASMIARVVYQGPIEAPIAIGQQVAELVVEAPGMEPARFDLVAGADVPRGGLAVRVGAASRLALERARAAFPAAD